MVRYHVINVSRDVIKARVDRYSATVPENEVQGIRSYIEHVIGFSEFSDISESIPEIQRQGLWSIGRSWEPRELDRFIIPECAGHLKWNKISIHRTHPVFLKGRRIDKKAVYIENKDQHFLDL